MYILLIYADPNKECLVFYGYFDKIKDIIQYTNGVLRYSDIKINDDATLLINLFLM